MGARQADELQNRADALLARADTVDSLIDTTQEELAEKRKEFEHYKNRAQTEMAIALQARRDENAGRGGDITLGLHADGINEVRWGVVRWWRRGVEVSYT